MYMAMKHIHMTLALLSISFFVFRAVLHFMHNPLLQKKLLKIAPHVIDTCLLVAGFSLAIHLSLKPGDNPWLIAKLVALVLYIFLGLVTLKLAKSAMTQKLAFVLALMTFGYIFGVALTKQPGLGLF